MTTGRGYVHYVLYTNGKRKAYMRHRLLGRVFKPIDNEDDYTIDHVNGIPGDDDIDNLEYVSIKENIKRYYSSGKTKAYKKVLIRFLKDSNKVLEFKTHIEAAKYLKVHRYEILRRLTKRFGFIFKDYTQIKFSDDTRDFIDYDDIENERSNCMLANKLKAYNHFTNEIMYFDKMLDACKLLSIKPSTLSIKMKERFPVFNSGWEIKYINDTSDWYVLNDSEKIRLRSGGLSVRPVVVIDIKTNTPYYFNSAKNAADYYSMLPTTMNYRLTAYKNRPSKDGYVYKYADEYIKETEFNGLS